MRKALPIILFLSIAAACLSGCRDAETRRTLRRMMGSTVVLPEKVTCVQNGEVFPMPEELRSKPKLIIFVDSTECSSCQVGDFIRYKDLYKESTAGGLFCLFPLVSTKKSIYKDIQVLATQIASEIPIYFDDNSCFEMFNQFIPEESKYHAITVDENNRIVLVGDPIYNETTMKLFHTIFSN